MQHHADWVEAHPDDLGGMEDLRITEAYISGRLEEARQLLEDRVLILRQQNQDENAANNLALRAWWESITGSSRQAQDYSRSALDIAPSGRYTRQPAAFALAAAGATEEAEEIAASVSAEFPQSTLWHGRGLPTIEANMELWKKSPAKAVEILGPAKRFEVVRGACIYTRGRAYLALKQGEAAAAEFQKILDHPGITRLSMEYPLAHLGLGRAKGLMGEKIAARKHYQDFFALWKDANPDIPVLIEAKAEYEKLLAESE
jgi:tetratricopeptide (TPR) repeat protein